MIKYGSHVAFLFEGTIRFGFVAAIVQRTNAEGEKTEYVITSIDSEGKANSDTTVKNEDHVVDLTNNWRKADAVLELARQTRPYEWAMEKSDEILNPPAPVAPVESAPPAAPLVTDGSKPKEIPF
jgi:hypothetical protein